MLPEVAARRCLRIDIGCVVGLMVTTDGILVVMNDERRRMMNE